MDIEKVLNKVDEVLTPQEVLRLKVRKGTAGLFDSKIGGTPYFPKNEEYPKGKQNEFNGKPLVLLAQLNFEKLPHISDFPKKGILQFFIAPDDLYGMSSEPGAGAVRQDNFRVVYHENIITDESQLMTADDMPVYPEEDDYYLPFDGEYELMALEKDMAAAGISDYRFNDVLVKCYNELYDEDVENAWDILDNVKDDILSDRDEGADAFIGGYPFFTQDDPRCFSELSDCDTVLFEINSVMDQENDIEILWGDMGTGTFLIPRENLRNLDFSRVVYNYDCY